MKNILTISTFLFFFTFSFGQNEKEIIKIDSLKKDSKTEISINIPKTFKIENVTSDEQNLRNTLLKNMPWIAAILIALLTILANYITSLQLRKTTKENLENQFKATISTKNRQAWINELRQNLSEYLSYSLYLSILKNSNPANTAERNKMFEKLILAQSKIELLVNHNKPEQKKLLDSIDKLFSSSSNSDNPSENENIAYRNARTELINSSRNLFDIHWKKIKDLK